MNYKVVVVDRHGERHAYEYHFTGLMVLIVCYCIRSMLHTLASGDSLLVMMTSGAATLEVERY